MTVTKLHHFRLALLALPSNALLWDAAEAPGDVTPASLALVPLLAEPPIRHLLVGLGSKAATNALGPTRGLDPAFVAHMRARGIAVEAMDSTAAATTFNFLNFEERPVAAALLAVDALDPVAPRKPRPGAAVDGRNIPVVSVGDLVDDDR